MATKKKARSSNRKDGIRVREVKRKVFEVDFHYDTPPGMPRGRFRRKSPYSARGKSYEWGRQQRELAIAAAWGRKAEEPARADPTAAREFAYWARRYIEDADSPAKRGGPNRASTVRSKTIVVTKHLIPAFGRRRVDAIGETDVERYILDKTSEGLAVGTLALHCTRLRGVLRLAKKKGAGAERLLEVPETTVESRTEDLPATLSEAQTEQLLEAFADAPSWQLAMLSLLFRGGLRCGESLGLRWADVDFAQGTIRIRRAVSEGELERTKGGKARTIPLHWQAREALLALGPSDGWVFPSPRKINELKPRSYRTVLGAIRDRWDGCGFVGDDGGPVKWGTHIGRHSLGRHWATRGWPLRGLQELLGHSDVSITQIYAHWSPSETAPLLDQLGRPDERADLTAKLRAAGVDERALRAAGLV